jgi:SAM-dependent methyltransferase
MLRLLGKVRRRLARRVFHLPEGPDGTVGSGNTAGRERWLEQTLAAVPAGGRILDAGAGELQYKRFCSHLQYVSQDFAQYDGQGDGSGLQRHQWNQSGLDLICDITDIPEPDASFDAVLCVEVLEHLPAPVDALRELARLLKPGGTLILTAPVCSLTHFAPYFYQTGFSRHFYEYWLPRFGLEVDEIAFNGNYFEYLAQEIVRLPEVADRYASTTLTRWEHYALNILLRLLHRCSTRDSGSQELLSFGLHVCGRKTK